MREVTPARAFPAQRHADLTRGPQVQRQTFLVDSDGHLPPLAARHPNLNATENLCLFCVLTEQPRMRGDAARPSPPRAASEPTPHDAEATRAQSRICCAVCRTHLADSGDALSIGGHHHHSFINPHGFMYRIRCFASARNVSTRGTPSGDFTWFRGYTWCVIECVTCSSHLGWRFDAKASTFFALVTDRIVVEDEPVTS